MGDLLTLGKPSKPVTWVGRTVMLNTAVQPRYQTKGFALNPKNPVICVPADAMDIQVQMAIDAGILIDITDAHTTGLQIKGSELSPVVKGEAKELPIFTGKDSSGNTYFITPKDQADLERMQREIAETGGLRIPKKLDQGVSMDLFSDPPPALESI